MKKNRTRFLAKCMAVLTLAAGLCGPLSVQAAEDEKPYLALGADLNEQEKATVLQLLQVDSADLDKYEVITVTNAEEHSYLDGYLDAGVIGTRALSSVVVEKKEEGSGINVKTSNITYCTTGMYQNALATAGLKDADIRVAGPFNISGTAALVGAMKAYGEMTGETIEAENADAATDELILTCELADSIGEDSAEALIGAVKDSIVAEEVSDPEEIEAVIEEKAQEVGVTLTEEEISQIRSLMEKIGKLDLDVDSLKQQVQDLYNKLEDMDINISSEQVQGFFDTVMSWLQNILDTVKGWLG